MSSHRRHGPGSLALHRPACRISKIEQGKISGIEVVRVFVAALGGGIDVVTRLGDQSWKVALTICLSGALRIQAARRQDQRCLLSGPARSTPRPGSRCAIPVRPQHVVPADRQLPE